MTPVVELKLKQIIENNAAITRFQVYTEHQLAKIEA